MNSIHDSSPEAVQGSSSTEDNGETVTVNSAHDSSAQADQVKDNADMNSAHDSSAQADQVSSSTEDNADMNSSHDSSPQAAQRSASAQVDEETAASLTPESYSPTNTEPGVSDTNGNTEHGLSKTNGNTEHGVSETNGNTEHGLPETNGNTEHGVSDTNGNTEHGVSETNGNTEHGVPETNGNTEHGVPETNGNTETNTQQETRANQEDTQYPRSITAAPNESDSNDSPLTPTAHGYMVESNSLSEHTHVCDEKSHMSQVSKNASSVPETNASSDNEINDHTSHFSINVVSGSDRPSSSNTTRVVADVSQNLAMSNTSMCPFSEHPLHGNVDDNSSTHTHTESAGIKDSHSGINDKIASISLEDSHQATSGSEKIRSTSSTVEEVSLMSSRFQRQSPAASRGIRNLFPQVSAEQSSEGRERSSPEMENRDEDNSGNQITEDSIEGDVVLVTGGCGFLGQHIVKLLNLRAPHVAEIRVLDLEHFQKKLDYPTTKRVKSLVGDISNSEFVHTALKGVNCVIHVAGLISWGTFPDYDGMERVNVKGTLNVLNACLDNNVQRLIYCSTVDVAVGNTPIRGGTEENTPVPDNFLFPGYPETKYHGERIILGAAHLKQQHGGHLQTVILRPNVLYGELDKYYVTSTLRIAKQSMGILYQIGNGKAMIQQAYVGNTAWAFVCADVAMRANPALTREIFYIPDNTPVQNSFTFMMPFLEVHGLKLSNGHLSYALLHSAVAAAELFAKALSPVMKLNLPVQSCTIAYINTDLYFLGVKAQRLLNYEPIYTPSDAMEMSMKYYANLELEERSGRFGNPRQS